VKKVASKTVTVPKKVASKGAKAPVTAVKKVGSKANPKKSSSKAKTLKTAYMTTEDGAGSADKKTSSTADHKKSEAAAKKSSSSACDAKKKSSKGGVKKVASKTVTVPKKVASKGVKAPVTGAKKVGSKAKNLKVAHMTTEERSGSSEDSDKGKSASDPREVTTLHMAEDAAGSSPPKKSGVKKAVSKTSQGVKKTAAKPGKVAGALKKDKKEKKDKDACAADPAAPAAPAQDPPAPPAPTA